MVQPEQQHLHQEHQQQQGMKQKPFDGTASGVSTCVTGSSRSAEAIADADPVLEEAPSGSHAPSLSSSCLSFASRKLRRRRSHSRVPLISVTSLYNRLQTSGVVLIDCRKGAEFMAGHLPDALHCPHIHTGPHLTALSCAGQMAKTVEDVVELTENDKLREARAEGPH